MTGPRTLLVRESTEIVPGIRELALADPAGRRLPGHPAGSHLVLDCGDGLRNSYSLLGPGTPAQEYRIAVLRLPGGRGGSVRLHRLRAGDRIVADGPRSAFAPVASARRHVLVAGGIGVTPMLAHARAAVRHRRPVEMLYVHRSGTGAYRSELAALLGDRLTAVTGRAAFAARLEALLVRQPLGTHLYTCGPEPLVDHVLDRAARLGWPAGRLHSERFTAPEPVPGVPFTVRLARSGRDVAVPGGASLLDALLAAGVPVAHLCRQGVCGECRVPVLGGTPLHRDEFLAEDERHGAVMCCVSRSASDTLEVDL
ncbi:PDR/VanB family oxidoreductase [Pseudonocardia kongjuensis]|uniref:PDR/VanB family oxidoreductase n=1 Tax=Pseudonocardia kongjuensis TaxID=102227 RepID=A0ABN1XVI4_9PSEU